VVIDQSTIFIMDDQPDEDDAFEEPEDAPEADFAIAGASPLL
jgi:hypothetical protein